MPNIHIRTIDGILIRFDDTKYHGNINGGSNVSTYDIVRLSDSATVMRIISGVGTEIGNIGTPTTDTFIGMQRITLP